VLLTDPVAEDGILSDVVVFVVGIVDFSLTLLKVTVYEFYGKVVPGGIT
jgi:hypothetical protein